MSPLGPVRRNLRPREKKSRVNNIMEIKVTGVFTGYCHQVFYWKKILGNYSLEKGNCNASKRGLSRHYCKILRVSIDQIVKCNSFTELAAYDRYKNNAEHLYFIFFKVLKSSWYKIKRENVFCRIYSLLTIGWPVDYHKS